MVKIAAEVEEGPVTRHVSIIAPSLERALELAGRNVASYRILSASDAGRSYQEEAAQPHLVVKSRQKGTSRWMSGVTWF